MSSFARGLEVLLAVADSGPMTVHEIVAALKLPQSTAYRYVRTLIDFGLLQDHGGVYSPGPRALHLAQQSVWHERLVDVATPILQELVDATDETAVLTVRVGDACLCLDSVPSPRPIRLSFRRGVQTPLHLGASAKIVLAYAPESVIERVGARLGEADAGALRAELRTIRAEGRAITYGDIDLDAVGIACPVLDRAGEFVCGISIAGPTVRIDRDGRLEHAAAAVAAAARRLTEAIAAGALPTSRAGDGATGG